MQTHFMFNVSAQSDRLVISSPLTQDFPTMRIQRGTATDGDLLAMLEQMLALYIGVYGGPIEAQRSINLVPGPNLKHGTKIHISFVPFAPQPLPN